MVVGHGMVGSRLVEDLTARARLHGVALDVTVLGAEEYEPYNRVMLSEVVAGAVDVAAITLPRAPVDRATVLAGVSARSVDRARRTVLTTQGAEIRYDVLVLATGARARIPRLTGLPDGTAEPGGGPRQGSGSPGPDLPAGVHALRTLDDAREIVAATVNAHRAVVLGGGVLGLEVACGLARRGLAVTVVHGGTHPMDRQLDEAAGAAVLHGLDRLGIDHRTRAVADAVLVTDGRARGLRLRGTDGAADEDLPADLVVLTAGTVPETALAARAGLAVARGVVVGPDCATSDPAVYAVGDCAEPREGSTGLIAQGWDQARRLAAMLVPDPGRPPHSAGPALAADASGADVVRLKAHGLDVVSMGVSGSRRPPAAGTRPVRLSDPAAGRHVEVVVDGERVVGATCVGAGRVAADLTAAYSRGTPIPADPAQLLLRPVAGAAPSTGAEPSPTLMPDRATVCRCNGVTKGELVACWRDGARSVEDIARRSRATTGCGGCTEAVCGIVDWLQRSDTEGTAPDEQGAAPVRQAEGRATVRA